MESKVQNDDSTIFEVAVRRLNSDGSTTVITDLQVMGRAVFPLRWELNSNGHKICFCLSVESGWLDTNYRA